MIDWMTPDPDEDTKGVQYGSFLLPREDRFRIAAEVRRIRHWPKGRRLEEVELLAASFGVSRRTAERYANLPHQCERCLTLIHSWKFALCTFCRRSRK